MPGSSKRWRINAFASQTLKVCKLFLGQNQAFRIRSKRDLLRWLLLAVLMIAVTIRGSSCVPFPKARTL
jgi:hypothetical protein